MASMRFLTTEELEALTGYKQKARQARYLTGLGIPFTLNATGRAVVLADRLSALGRVQKLNPEWLEERQRLGSRACTRRSV